MGSVEGVGSAHLSQGDTRSVIFGTRGVKTQSQESQVELGGKFN